MKRKIQTQNPVRNVGNVICISDRQPIFEIKRCLIRIFELLLLCQFLNLSQIWGFGLQSQSVKVEMAWWIIVMF